MKGPCTLLGRTALCLGVLMLVSQTLWLASAAYFLIRPFKLAYGQQISAVIVLAQTLLESRARNGDQDSSEVLIAGTLENFKIVPDSYTRPEFDASPDFMISELNEILSENFGPAVRVYRGQDKTVLWVRFPAQGKLFWAVFPKVKPPVLYYIRVSVGIGIAIAIVGAYIIIYQLTQHLRKITAAVRAMGRGEPSVLLEETGAREIRDLSRGFNQMAADLTKLDHDRRLMLAGISHDLKTPLTRLRIAVELAATHAEPEIAAGIVHDIEDMDSILKQFLDYARDGTEEQPSVNDLNSIVSDVCDRYQARGNVIETSLGHVPSFPFRKLAMYRVITNIVDNAVRYGREGIQIKTQSDGAMARIFVTDQGPGIRGGIPNDYIKAFSRENTSRSQSGAGLGLTIVDRILRTHGGRLHLENRETGGLLARVELPILTSVSGPEPAF